MPTVQQVIDLSRSLMLDVFGTAVYTDAILIPLVDAASRSMHAELADAGGRLALAEVELLNIAANVVLLDKNSTPALPADLIRPHRLRERANGSGDNYQDMEKFNGWLPDLEDGQYFGAWDWRNQNILLPPVNRAMDLEIEYEQEFARLTVVGDVVPIDGSEVGLASWVASRVVRARGQPNMARDLYLDYERETALLASRIVKNTQQTPIRKQAYNYNFGRGGFR